MEAVWKRATADALAYEKGGADALIIENYGDVPFTPGRVPAETVAAMSAVGVYLREVAGVSLPLGYNVLRNDPASALGLAAVSRGRFVRVNVHSGAMVTDQGVIEGRAFETVRLRQRLSPEVAIWADVHVKHAQPLGGGDLVDAARDAVQRGLADGLIVSGVATGAPVALEDLQRIREACPDVFLLVGSGADASRAAEMLEFADGLIVGTSVKRAGKIENAVEEERVRTLRKVMDSGVS